MAERGANQSIGLGAPPFFARSPPRTRAEPAATTCCRRPAVISSRGQLLPHPIKEQPERSLCFCLFLAKSGRARAARHLFSSDGSISSRRRSSSAALRFARGIPLANLEREKEFHLSWGSGGRCCCCCCSSRTSKATCARRRVGGAFESAGSGRWASSKAADLRFSQAEGFGESAAGVVPAEDKSNRLAAGPVVMEIKSIYLKLRRPLPASPLDCSFSTLMPPARSAGAEDHDEDLAPSESRGGGGRIGSN